MSTNTSTRKIRERGILHAAPMVRALLAGTKKQTRRLMTPQPDRWHTIQPMWGVSPDGHPFGTPYLWREVGPDYPDSEDDDRRCPYGVPGDRLWVRETWYCDDYTAPSFERARVGYVGTALSDEDIVKQWRKALDYRADHDCRNYEAGCPCSNEDGRGSWRPSLFMPRWAARLTLEITDVRVQRLHDLTEADAWAEGIAEVDGMLDAAAIARAARVLGCSIEDARATYGALWDQINGKRRRREYLTVGDPGYTAARPWRMVRDDSAQLAANPWVWAITYRPVEMP